MKIAIFTKRPFVRFVLLSNLIFWLFLASIGFGMMLGVPEGILYGMQIIAAWLSTFAFLLLFKRIVPGDKIKDYVKRQFEPRIKISIIIIVTIIQILIFLIAKGFSGAKLNLALSLPGMGMLILTFFDLLARGSLGEELGWRGYALNELQKKMSPLKAALIIGVLWGFWHTPLWFFSGYVGLELLKYSVLFMIAVLGISVIITVFYNLNHNLIVPIIIHQSFNFLLALNQGDLLDILVYTATAYGLVALVLVAMNPKQVLYKVRRSIETA
jgi:hypothetical protein